MVTEGYRRRSSDRGGFVRQFTPGNWIQIGLLLFAIVGGYYNFQSRISRLEEYRIEHAERERERKADVDSRLEQLQNKEIVQAQLAAITARLERIEKKIDSMR